MAQFKSDTYTAQETAAGNASKMINTAELVSGKSAFLQCKVTVPAGTAAGDTILAGFIPSNMSVVPGAVVTAPLAAGSGTFDIGTTDEPTAIATGASAHTAGSTLLDVVPNFKTAERQAIVLTLNGALTAGRVFYLNFPLVNSN